MKFYTHVTGPDENKDAGGECDIEIKARVRLYNTLKFIYYNDSDTDQTEPYPDPAVANNTNSHLLDSWGARSLSSFSNLPVKGSVSHQYHAVYDGCWVYVNKHFKEYGERSARGVCMHMREFACLRVVVYMCEYPSMRIHGQ